MEKGKEALDFIISRKLNVVSNIDEMKEASNDCNMILLTFYAFGFIDTDEFEETAYRLQKSINDTTKNLIILKEQAGGR